MTALPLRPTLALGLLLLANATAPGPLAQLQPPAGCNYTFRPALKGEILGGYAKGYSPTAMPYANTLEAAQGWCCGAGPHICGGVTHQNGTFDSRVGWTPRHCGTVCDNVTSWVLNAPRHGPSPSPAPPSPPCTPPCKPLEDLPVWPVPRAVTLGSGAFSFSTSFLARLADFPCFLSDKML